MHFPIERRHYDRWSTYGDETEPLVSLSVWGIVLYGCLLCFCFHELRFFVSGVDVEARVEQITQRDDGQVHVRYWFRHPETDEIVRDGAVLANLDAEIDATLAVEYLDLFVPISRPAQAAHLWVLIVFVLAHVIPMTAIVWWLAREANQPVITRQQRLMREYRRRQAREKIPQVTPQG